VPRAGPGPLLLRIISAGVMAPVALAAVWFERPWLVLLVLLAMAVMGWEWSRLATRGGFGLLGALVIAAGLSSVGARALGGSGGIVLAIAAAGAGLVYLVAQRQRAEPVWVAAGTLWIAAGSIGFLSLGVPPWGDHWTALWLLGVVWVTDIAAYAAGRSIGGPKLAPAWSPNKTWAGFIGGVASAGVVGLVAAWLAGGRPLTLFAVSLGLGAAAQAGDLVESLAKRHFGVKDSSGLIPGHGGLLDRVDGLLAAALAAWLLMAATGESPLVWR